MNFRVQHFSVRNYLQYNLRKVIYLFIQLPFTKGLLYARYWKLIVPALNHKLPN